jgi:glycosyltransferase involved in cell wall biosynthesis
MTLVTIITPVFNGEKYIGEAIRSVASSSYSTYEHFIVDDGSTDNTQGAIRECLEKLGPEARAKVRVLATENFGEAEADNLAVAESTGDLIIVLNADDVVGEHLLQRSVEVMNNNPEIVVSYPDWSMIDSGGGEIRKVTTKEFSLEALIGDFECLPGPGACIRRLSLGGDRLRNPNYSLVSDYESWQRLCLRGDFKRIPEVLASWRLHGKNLSIFARGYTWAVQAILVTENFTAKIKAQGDKRLQKFASLGVSRAYLLAALQGKWDSRVPTLSYLWKSIKRGAWLGKPLRFRDTLILASIIWILCKRFALRISRTS